MNALTKTLVTLTAGLLTITTQFAADLPVGTAKGSYTPEGGKAAAITNAAAFVDQKDDRKPTILLLSDKKLPTEKWKSEFDLMRSHEKFTGVLFWLDKEGSVFRSDTYLNGRQASVAGLFELKLESKGGKDLSGSALSHETASEKLDVTFHATVK